MKELSIFNQLRPITVGFDSVFENFERMFSDDFLSTTSNYPAYNIVKTKDNHYDVEVALAGFNKKDIKVSYADGLLSIESIKNDKTKILSTGGMIDYANKSDANEFVVATETGILHQLRKQNPKKEFHPVKENAVCEYMKMITLEKVYKSLNEEVYEVKVPEEIINKAIKPITRMINIR